MSGVITAATALALSTAYTIYSGERAAKDQQEALQRQKEAQTQAENRAITQTQLSEQAQNKANQKVPDITSIMQNAQKAAAGGASSTMLTGPGGIDTSSLQLGKSTLLGS